MNIEAGILKELCGDCGGCSMKPGGISSLCSNPLEKYLHRKHQLFLKTEDNPEGYKATVKCSRCGKLAEWVFGEKDSFCQEHWEECCSEQWWKTHCGTVEPAESRLLPDKDLMAKVSEELCKVLALRYGYDYGVAMTWIEKNIVPMIIAKTASILKAECQQKLKRIKEKIEEYKGMEVEGHDFFIMITSEEWEALWKEEGL